MQEKLAEAAGRGEEEMNFSGSTAMVALFDGRSRLLCASLGDCRAVLSRKGMAVGVSAPEHKANRKDEIARVVKRGVRAADANVGREEGQWGVNVYGCLVCTLLMYVCTCGCAGLRGAGPCHGPARRVPGTRRRFLQGVTFIPFDIVVPGSKACLGWVCVYICVGVDVCIRVDDACFGRVCCPT